MPGYDYSGGSAGLDFTNIDLTGLYGPSPLPETSQKQQQEEDTNFDPIPQPSPPQPTPPTNPWDRTNRFVDPRGIKQPDPSVILFDSGAISPEYLIELEYEDISGIELINMSRSDLIDGQSVVYSPIKKLSSLRNQYNPNNIIAIPSYFYSEFSKYRIDLILRGISLPYFDENGSLIIEIKDVKDDEIIEVEIDSSGTINIVDFS
jgi:hypothetical protein